MGGDEGRSGPDNQKEQDQERRCRYGRYGTSDVIRPVLTKQQASLKLRTKAESSVSKSDKLAQFGY